MNPIVLVLLQLVIVLLIFGAIVAVVEWAIPDTVGSPIRTLIRVIFAIILIVVLLAFLSGGASFPMPIFRR